MEELHDLVVAATTSTCRVTGRGVALFGGGGGGFAVLSSDAIDREGLEVPKFPQSAIDEMREYIPVAGSSVNNPIDAFPPEEHLEDMLRLVATAEGIDNVFMSPMTGWRPPGSSSAAGQSSGASVDKEEDSATDKLATKAARQMYQLQDDTGTPVVGILRSGRMARMMGLDMDEICLAAYRDGIGTYGSVTRAARTVAQMLDWKAARKGLPDIFGSGN